MKSISARTFLFATTLFLWFSAASGQSFPDHPVKIIVPYGVGTLTDLSARLTAKRLADLWKQPVIVENVTGAGGVIGTQAVVRAAPDGYTIGLIASNFAMSPAVLAHMPYDSQTDLKPIIHVTYSEFVFAVHPAVPAKTLAEFIDLAKSKPGELYYGSSGNGSSPHLAIAKLAYMAGIKLTHVPYKTLGQAITDLLAGRVAMVSGASSVFVAHVASGRLRALAVTGSKESTVLPGVPPASLAGVPGYELKNWNGFVAPANTPAPIIAKLAADIGSIHSQPDFRQQMISYGVEIEILDAKAFSQRIAEEIAMWGRVVKESGIKVE